jgi:hypothetical protein
MLFGAAACSDADDPVPTDPDDVNVEADDILPPGTERPLDDASSGYSR